MRPGLRWILIVTVLLSAAAVLWPEGSTSGISSAVERASADTTPTLDRASQALPDAQVVRVPERLAKASLLEKPLSDPFGAAQAPDLPKPAPIISPIVAPQPSPQPPALNYRYLGQMTTPEGERIVYLAHANSDIQIRVGTQLDEGYVVQAISDKAVDLYYPALSTKASIAIPPAQESTAQP